MSICTLCQEPIPDLPPEAWTTQGGQVVYVARSEEPSAIVDTSLGEFEICLSCYRHPLPSFFTPEDLAAIHYQFGLEYSDRRDFERSTESLVQARILLETADIVAHMAYAECELGHKEAAAKLYRRALEIDPSHVMSQQNLRRLYEKTA
jgi:tetratricopeptide (TPR) repeat protein